jgi:pantothenate synthetase
VGVLVVLHGSPGVETARATDGAVAVLAVRLGATRLIDNLPLA